MKTRLIRLSLVLAVGLLISAALAGMMVRNETGTRNTKISPVAGSAIGGPFRLIDQNGIIRTEKDFPGQYRLIYFGFTFCPAICPTELQKMTLALNKIGPLAENIQPLFITIDPERDNQDVMASYMKSFHPRLIGLTGTPEQVRGTLQSYRVYAKKVQDPAMSAYTMDHSSYIYLMSPDNALIDLYGTDSTPGDIAAGIQRALEP